MKSKRKKSFYKFQHHACKVCVAYVKGVKSVCSCGECYIRETVRSVEVCWNEHKNPRKMSNLWKQIKDYVEHAFHWLIIVKAPTRMFQRELLKE